MNNLVTGDFKGNNNYIIDELQYSVLLNYLTMYVNLQKALIEKIIISVDDDAYHLLNCKFNKLHSVIKSEDNLLDILITIAPKKIKIYNADKFTDKELLKTVIAIFRERVDLYIDDLNYSGI